MRAIAFLWLVGCAHGGDVRAVAYLHAAERGCASRDVAVAAIGARTYAAEGCGIVAIYACAPGELCRRTDAAAEERPVAQVIARRESADLETMRARTRAAPQAPELGGMWHEAEALCVAQSAAFWPVVRSDGGGSMTCQLGDRRLFWARVDRETRRIDIVDVFLEGASVPDLRAQYTREHGEPEESIDEEGRLWTWRAGDRALVLRMYELGARVTTRGVNARSDTAGLAEDLASP